MVCAFLFALTNQALADPLSDSWIAAYDAGDYVKAEKLLRPLAKQGNALAQFNLGFMYAKGQGVQQDYVLAYMWADVAAADATDSEYRKQYSGLRNSVAKKMTVQQIIKARKLEQKCAANEFKGC
jgi:TPR repeat protein